jgi:hypothetical protein
VNYSTAVFLINDKCRAIEVIYEPDIEGCKPAKREIVKTFDQAIKTGDLLIVPSTTRFNVTTVKVTNVDVDLDPTTHEHIRWVIGTIDMAVFDELKATEDGAIAMIKAAERTDAKKKLREKMFAHVDEEKLKALALANLSDAN